MSVRAFQDLLDTGASPLRPANRLNDWEEIYRCPWCEEERGKADTRGHLYWNVKKRRGICFRCNTKVVYGKKLTLEEICQDYVREREAAPDSVESSWQVEPWSVPAWTHPAARAYLENRRLGVDRQELYQLRYTEEPYPAIVIPNGPDPTNFFQVRKLEVGPRDLRYINPGCTKPVYGSFLPPTPRVVLAEGPFSAIGAATPGVNGLGLYGKSISAHQKSILESMDSVEEFVVCLDGGEGFAALCLADELFSLGKPVKLVALPYGADPNDCVEEFPRWLQSAVGVNAVSSAWLLAQLRFTKQDKIQLTRPRWKQFVAALQSLKDKERRLVV